MILESLIVLVVIGAIAGWMAGKIMKGGIMKGGGFGLVGNVIVRIVGANVDYQRHHWHL